VLAQKQSPCPWMTLPDTWDEFMDLPDRTHKLIVRRKAIKRMARRHEIETTLSTGADDLATALDRFFTIHQERWVAADEQGCFESDQMRTFYRKVSEALSEEDWLRLSALNVDGTIEAMEFGLYYNNCYYFMQGGCSARGFDLNAGNALRYRILESVVDNTREFHFLRGAERYKYQWGGGDKWTMRLLAGRGVGGYIWVLWNHLRRLRRVLRERQRQRREARPRDKKP
jgi:CelD/BcsL family acetyltransferase involved in cellulose biosynthesis